MKIYVKLKILNFKDFGIKEFINFKEILRRNFLSNCREKNFGGVGGERLWNYRILLLFVCERSYDKFVSVV